MKSPQISQLSVASAFDGLDLQQKLYAHYMAKYVQRSATIELHTEPISELHGLARALYLDKYHRKPTPYLIS